MIRLARSLPLLSALALSAFAVDASAAWAPPIGIPAPAFGINEVAPASPSGWTVATAGFYYVDATTSAATDTSNPYGTSAKPRRTIPNVLPAGAVVELHGTYDTGHTSPNTIVANGTAAQPVFIRGVSASSKPVARAQWELTGNYFVVENIEFGPLNSSQTGSVVIRDPSNHLALRFCDLHGTLTDGGLGIVTWGSALTQNIVIYGDSIHDNGDVNATFDQDIHGIVVNGQVSNLWVVDSTLARNSGDGIQISAGSAAGEAALHNVYVGRNTSFNNKQTGFWAKQATDVIFSQNTCYGHRPSNSSMGQCMGYQYATQRAWFLFNNISDSEYGIAVMSDNTSEGSGTGVDAFFIGNVIHNIHHSDPAYSATDPWSTAAILLVGGTNRHVINNTMYDVDAGVNVPQSNVGVLEIADNIIAHVTQAGADHVFVEDSALANITSLHHNLLEGDARIQMGGSQVHLTQAQLAALRSTNAAPLLMNPAGNDFHLQSTSPAIDTGETNSVYATFQQLYGISIAKDADGNARPAGLAMDLGAYEAPGAGTGCGPLTAPAAPTNLAVTISGTTGVFSWAEPTTTCNAPANFWIEAGSASGASDLGSQSTGNLLTTLTASNMGAGSFYVRVKAQNSAGLSGPSNEALVVVGVPGPPSGLTVGVSSRTLTFSWSKPTLGAAPTSYVLEAGTAPGRTDASAPLPNGTATTFVATNVTPGTYYLRIRAKNATGSSLPSNEVTVTVQ